MFVHINGQIRPASSPEARAFQPGAPDFPGIYTTLRVERGVASDLPAHLQRLRRQAAELGLPPLPSLLPDEDLPGIIRQLCAANGLQHGAGRLRVTLAARRARGDLVVAVEPLPRDLEHGRDHGIRAITLGPEHARTHHPQLKTLAMAASLTALAEARRQGATEAIVHDRDGWLLEGAISNIFVFREGRWFTPPDDGRILAGLTRGRVLQKVAGSTEAPLTLKDLNTAEEIFICNSLRGIVPVVFRDGHRVGDGRPGPATLRARRALEE